MLKEHVKMYNFAKNVIFLSKIDKNRKKFKIIQQRFENG